MPKEFVFYIDKHSLQLISRHEKLNKRHVKWIEYMKKNHLFLSILVEKLTKL